MSPTIGTLSLSAILTSTQMLRGSLSCSTATLEEHVAELRQLFGGLRGNVMCLLRNPVTA